jgi:signal transduction histidine kinase
VRGGLTRRVLVASGLLALVVAAAFAVLLSSVVDLHALEQRARRSERVLVVANRTERLIVDAETGQRGFVITGREEFLQPWHAARAAFPEQLASLERLLAENPEQAARGRRIAQAGTSYLQDYSIPLVATARRDLAAARSTAVTAEGKRRVDAIRAEFAGFETTEQALAAARRERSDAAARRAVLAAGGGLAVSVLLIAVFATDLTRTIARPVRRAAATADQLAGGDLGARLPGRAVGEIRVLERSFNAMATSLQESRDALDASRARIVAATDQARRRIERDLHDGIQQRLVSLLLDLRAGEAAVPPGHPQLSSQLADLADGLADALDDLRELSRGIHPAILSEGGLAPALKALARRSPVPVEVSADVPHRLPESVEVGAYYVVSEALANAAKHAQASIVHVDAHVSDHRLHLCIGDDGVGAAEPGRGSGLVGLADRVQALGGTLSVTSPAGKGTTVLAALPVSGR